MLDLVMSDFQIWDLVMSDLEIYLMLDLLMLDLLIGDPQQILRFLIC